MPIHHFFFEVEVQGHSPIRSLFSPQDIQATFSWFDASPVHHATWALSDDGLLEGRAEGPALSGRFHPDFMGMRDGTVHLAFVPGPDDGIVGAVVRYQSEATHYLVAWDGGSQAGWGEGNFRLYRVRDGIRHLLASASAPRYAEAFYQLDVEMQGDRLLVRLVQLGTSPETIATLDVIDPEPIEAGSFGPALEGHVGALWQQVGVDASAIGFELIVPGEGDVDDLVNVSESFARLVVSDPVGTFVRSALEDLARQRGIQSFEVVAESFVLRSHDPQIVVFFSGEGPITKRPEAFIAAYFLRPQARPAAPVLTFTGEALGTDRIRWQWTLGQGSVRELQLLDADGNTIVSLGPSETEYLETGLAPGITVTRRLRVVGEGGDIAESPIVSQQTLSAAPEPPGTPAYFQGLGVSADTILWTWQATGSLADGFEIYDADTGDLVASVGRGQRFYEETGLLPDTTYRRYIVAFNQAGRSAPSGIVEARTLAVAEGPPKGVEGFFGIPVSSTAIRWMWQFDGQCDGFLIYGDEGTAPIPVGPELRAYEEDGLEPGKVVGRRIAAFNGAGIGPVSPVAYQAPFDKPADPDEKGTTVVRDVQVLDGPPLEDYAAGVIGEDSLAVSVDDGQSAEEEAWALVGVEAERRIPEQIVGDVPFSYRIAGSGTRTVTRSGGDVEVSVTAYPPVYPQVTVEAEVSGSILAQYQWFAKASHTQAKVELGLRFGKGAKADILVVIDDGYWMGPYRDHVISGLMDLYDRFVAHGVSARFGFIRVRTASTPSDRQASFRLLNGNEAPVDYAIQDSELWLSTSLSRSAFRDALNRLVPLMNSSERGTVRQNMNATLHRNNESRDLVVTVYDNVNRLAAKVIMQQGLDHGFAWGGHKDWVESEVKLILTNLDTGRTIEKTTDRQRWTVDHRGGSDFAPTQRTLERDIVFTEQELSIGRWRVSAKYFEDTNLQDESKLTGWYGWRTWTLEPTYATIQWIETYGTGPGAMVRNATTAWDRVPWDASAQRIVYFITNGAPEESTYSDAERQSVIQAFRSKASNAYVVAFGAHSASSFFAQVANVFYGSGLGQAPSNSWGTSAVAVMNWMLGRPLSYRETVEATLPYHRPTGQVVPLVYSNIPPGQAWKVLDSRSLLRMVYDLIQVGQTPDTVPVDLLTSDLRYGRPLAYGAISLQVRPVDLGPTLELGLNDAPLSSSAYLSGSQLQRPLQIRTKQWAIVASEVRTVRITAQDDENNKVQLNPNTDLWDPDGNPSAPPPEYLTIGEAILHDKLYESVLQPDRYGPFVFVEYYGAITPSGLLFIEPSQTTPATTDGYGFAYTTSEYAPAFRYTGRKTFQSTRAAYADEAFATILGWTDEIELYHDPLPPYSSMGWRYDGPLAEVKFRLINPMVDSIEAYMVNRERDNEEPPPYGQVGSDSGQGLMLIYAYSTKAYALGSITQTLAPYQPPVYVPMLDFAQSRGYHPNVARDFHFMARIEEPIEAPGVAVYWKTRQGLRLNRMGQQAGVQFPDALVFEAVAYETSEPYADQTPWVEGRIVPSEPDRPIAVMIPVWFEREHVTWDQLRVDLDSPVPLHFRWERPAPSFDSVDPVSGSPVTTDPSNLLWVWTDAVQTVERREQVRSLFRPSPTVRLKGDEIADVIVELMPEDLAPLGSYSDLERVRLVIVPSSINVQATPLTTPELVEGERLPVRLRLSLRGFASSPWGIRLAPGSYAVAQYRYERYPFTEATLTLDEEGRAWLPAVPKAGTPVLVKLGERYLEPGPFPVPYGFSPVFRWEGRLGSDGVIETGAVPIDPLSLDVERRVAGQWVPVDRVVLDGSTIRLDLPEGSYVSVSAVVRSSFGMTQPTRQLPPEIYVPISPTDPREVTVYYVPEDAPDHVPAHLDANLFRSGYLGGYVYLDLRSQIDRRPGRIELTLPSRLLASDRGHVITARVFDQDGVAMADLPVTLTIQKEGQILETLSALTDPAGIALFYWQPTSEALGPLLFVASTEAASVVEKVTVQPPSLGWGQAYVDSSWLETGGSGTWSPS